MERMDDCLVCRMQESKRSRGRWRSKMSCENNGGKRVWNGNSEVGEKREGGTLLVQNYLSYTTTIENKIEGRGGEEEEQAGRQEVEGRWEDESSQSNQKPANSSIHPSINQSNTSWDGREPANGLGLLFSSLIESPSTYLAPYRKNVAGPKSISQWSCDCL